MPEYYIVKAGNIREFEEAVNRNLQIPNHRLVGGVSIAMGGKNDNFQIVYVQAMMKS